MSDRSLYFYRCRWVNPEGQLYEGRATYPHTDKQGRHERPIRNTRSPRSEGNEGTHAVDNVQLNATVNDYNLRISECLCLHVGINLGTVGEARRHAPAPKTSSRWDNPEGKMYMGRAAYPHADKQVVGTIPWARNKKSPRSEESEGQTKSTMHRTGALGTPQTSPVNLRYAQCGLACA